MRKIFYGWWIILASSALTTYNGGILYYGFTAFFNPILSEFGWTRAATRRGYGIFAALGGGGGMEFGPNERVHGEKGDELPHSNPSVAGNPEGLFVIAWDDYRQGSSDIWLSRYNDDMEWSADVSPSPASGAGEQTNSSIYLDDRGDLHLIWVERDRPGAPTRIWYAHGRRIGDL